jgi:hypothetical protein
MTPLNKITDHRNYDADDYAYLTAKGWTDAEILARWDAEVKSGVGPCRWQTAAARSKLAAVTCRKLTDYQDQHHLDEQEESIRWILAHRRPGIPLDKAIRTLRIALSNDRAALGLLDRIASRSEG